MSVVKNFKILEIDEIEGTIVIDWLNGIVLNHEIPPVLLTDETFTEQQRVNILEQMRPADPIAINIPQGLLNMVDGYEVEPDPEEEPQQPEV